MKTTKRIFEELNEIIERNYDVIQNYRDASRNVDNELLRNFFISHGKEKLAMYKEMKEIVKDLGGKPAEEGSVFSLFKRSWNNFTASLSHGNEKEVCENCIAVEAKAVVEYKDLLKREQELPDSLKELLENQKQRTLNAIRELEAIKEKF
ncbi:PA2169 family four-helix-bundle protein [Pleomorphovibrio marinus]|uniref:PA2169 family four-helix-bundle protein n=1 Tax=Pleomorphovibrio marinus TaxID=2164132 RepID=UPI000E0AC73B|nr:PA2169 family four-helix-bundle protein [Pleomorphovibrio marinus]